MLRAQRRRIHSQIAAWYERVRKLQRRRMGWDDVSCANNELKKRLASSVSIMASFARMRSNDTMRLDRQLIVMAWCIHSYHLLPITHPHGS